MKPSTASPCITSTKIAETRAFYTKHLGARPVFDRGRHVSLEFEFRQTVQFIEPPQGMELCNPAGLTYNFKVVDVDADLVRLMASGLVPIMPIDNHPWGDRGFAIGEPNGVKLYIYSDREPSPEFKLFSLL